MQVTNGCTPFFVLINEIMRQIRQLGLLLFASVLTINSPVEAQSFISTEEPSDSWDVSGNYSISWYNKNLNEYEISTNKELAGLAYLVNNAYSNFEGKTIRLVADIDLSGKMWKSIGSDYSTYCFNGTFDGQGHVISNLYIGKEQNNREYYGFWGTVKNANIKNVTIQGQVIINNPMTNTNLYVGGLIGRAVDSNIEKCKCITDIVTYMEEDGGHRLTNFHVGGMIGEYAGYDTNRIISYCSHEGNVIFKQDVSSSRPPIVGGLIGKVESNTRVKIDFCENISSEIGGSYSPAGNYYGWGVSMGGIVGMGGCPISYSRNITNLFSLYVHSLNGLTGIGGIVGGKADQNSINSIVNCYSIVSKEKVISYSNPHQMYFGGISGNLSGNIFSSFSNSNVVKDNSSNVAFNNALHGSTAFTSEQMKSRTFLDELNIYSIIEEGGAAWTQDEGGYPYIAKLHEKPDVITVTSINLDKSSLILNIGKTKQLVATVFPDNATNKEVCWSSDNTNVATVSNTGLVTAISEGTATITCRANDNSGVTATCTVTVTDPNVIDITSTNFPDENFRNWVLEQYYGQDGKLTMDEIRKITSISMNEKNISTLKGIEYFTSLTYLNCSSNQLTSLDVSKNTALTLLYCNSNQLTSLDLSKNTALKSLRCYSNQLTSLDVSKNTALDYLSCYSNQLASLDVSKNTALSELHCYSNQLVSLDISKNTALKYMQCGDNQLISLDVSNTALTRFNCHLNQIKGKAMDDLINSLPYNSSDEIYKFQVISLSHDDEGNICTKNQVAAAKAKGWTPYCFVVGSGWLEYEGSDECQYPQGDVNGDGQVGIGDIVTVTNVMASNETDADVVRRADVNGDGEVGIGDIISITNIMAGQ